MLNVFDMASEPARSVIGAQSNFGNGGELNLRKELQKKAYKTST